MATSQQSGNNNKIFIIGMICLVLSLGLLLSALYILPFLLWDLAYDVPDFISDSISYFQENYNYSSAGSKLIVWLIFVIPGAITGYLSYYFSHLLDEKIDNEIDLESQDDETDEK